MTVTDTPMSPTTSANLPPAARERGPWSLDELLADPSRLDDRLADLETAVGAFEEHRPELDRASAELEASGRSSMAPERLLEILGRYEAIVEESWVLSSYGSLWFSSDTQSERALAFRNTVDQAVTGFDNRMLFFILWWRALPEEEAERLLPPAGGAHADQRHYLEELRRWSPYSLDERSEQLINLKDDDGVGGLLTVYSMLTNRLEFEIEVDGQPQRLTRDALMSYAYSPDPAQREATYQELYRVYGEEAKILGQIYIHRVRDWSKENIDLRGMGSPIAVRNLDNDVPDEAVDTLLSVCRERRGLFQRYFELKAGWLGLDRLRRYDIYAPLGTSDREIPYGEAVTEVLDTFGAFHPHLAETAGRVFAEGHIDSEIRKGKRGGALCSTVLPRFTPWVMVNYAGRLRDVATLAHELGHAVHSMLADHHSALTQQATLPLAETASVFGEMLVTDRLLERETEPLARREILLKALDDIYATVLRQAYFVIFENDAHAAIRAGASVEDLSRLYMENLAEQFGDSVEVPEEFRYEWVSIPHIFQSPFYCYAYSFGQLLVLALYRRYQQEGEAFKPVYLRLLGHGGSARPQEILAEAGIDMGDRAFWLGGMQVVEDLVDELEELS